MRRQRFIVVALAAIALVVAWSGMAALSRTDPWPANADMDIHNMADALALNMDIAPANVDQPGLTQKYLLALDYRVRHFAEILPVWNLKKLRMSADPLAEIRHLVHIGRFHSRVLVLLFILAAAGLVWSGTRSLESAGLAVILLSGSSGLLYHGLLNRPDLLCALFGSVLALLCAWRGTAGPTRVGRHVWLLLAGLCVGLAVLSKLPGMYYLVTCQVWFWLAALTAPSLPFSKKEQKWGGLLAVASGAVTLGLAFHFARHEHALSATATFRLRAMVLIATVLPWLPWVVGRSRLGTFLGARARELGLLAAGALATLPLSYLALRVVMTAPKATAYLAQVTQLVFDPGPLLRALLPAEPHVGGELLLWLKDSPFLFAAAFMAVAVAGAMRSISWSRKIFVILLLLNALGLAVLLGRYHYQDQFTIYAQVPLLLIWPLVVFELGLWRRPGAGADIHWMAPLVIVAAVTLLATAYFRVKQKYDTGHPAGRPLAGEPTLTFLFDHSYHPPEYRQLMLERYHDREEFTRALERSLAAPASRY